MRSHAAALLLRAAAALRSRPASAAAPARAFAADAPAADRRSRGAGDGPHRPQRDRGGDAPPPRPPPRLDEFGDALAPRVANAAGEGAPGWTLLGEDDALAATYWALDATGGRAPGAELNALLSRDAKDLMVALSAKGATVPQLATLFRVRRQRVAAILALRAAEAAARERGEDVHTDAGLLFEGGVDADRVVRAGLEAAAARVDAMRAAGGPNPRSTEDGDEDEDASAADAAPTQPTRAADGTPAADLVQGLWKCDRLRGVGEAAVAPLPRFPAFKLEPPDAAAPPPPDEATPSLSDVPAREAELAAAADAVAATEFGERLARNVARVAAGPVRAAPPRPRRPPGGWPLLVTPLGPRAPRPYVAEGGGVTRPLTAAEAAAVRRARPKARKRIV